MTTNNLRIVRFGLYDKDSWAETSTGETLPITNMLDFEGDETADIDECESFVCGPDSNGNWFAVYLEGYKQIDKN